MKTKIFRIGKRTLSVVLSLMMIVSTMLVGMVSTNAASAFSKGDTIYLDTSNFQGWDDNASVVALFYYTSNENWAYPTNNAFHGDWEGTGRDGNQYYKITSKKPLTASVAVQKISDNYHKVTVPQVDNLGYMRFIRVDSNNNQSIYNFSSKMSNDNKGSNNCVKINDWNNNSTWSTYSATTTSSWAIAGGAVDTAWSYTAGKKLSAVAGQSGLYSITLDNLGGWFSFYDSNNTQYGNTDGVTLAEGESNAQTITACNNAFNQSSEVSNVTVYLKESSNTVTVWYVKNVTTYTLSYGKVTGSAGSPTVSVSGTGVTGSSTTSTTTGTIEKGKSATFTVSASNLNYYNIQWYSNSTGTTAISGATSSTYTVSNVTSAKSAYVKLTPKTYQVKASTSSSTTGGTVTAKVGSNENAESFDAGSTVVLTATPDDGYYVATFTATCDDKTYTHTNGVITIENAAADITYSATYTVKPVINYSLTDSANSGATISATYDGTEIESGSKIIPGETAVFTVTGAEDTGLYTVTWNVGEETSTGNSVTVDNVNADTTVSATVTRNTYTVSGSASNATVTITNDGLEVDDGATFEAGSTIAIQAVAPSGYQLIGFTVKANGETYDLSDADVNNTITITGAKSNVTYTVTTRELVYGVDLTADKTVIKEGDSVTLTATAVNGSGNYTYEFTSSNTEEVLSPTGNTLVVSPTIDTIYTVTVTDNQTGDVVTDTISITIASTNIESLTIASNKTEVIEGESFTLSVVPVPAGKYTYNYYKVLNGSTEPTLIQTTKNASITITESTIGTHKYYVTVQGIDEEIKSENEITVAVTQSAGVHEVTVYFKAPTAGMYAPTVTVNGEPTAMTKYKVLGTTPTGSMTIAWYKATVSVDSSTENNTITFKTKRTKLNATIKGSFNASEYYFACDDLMYGTKVVDLTYEKEYKRNFFISATHMVYPTPTIGQEDALGWTVVENTLYRMGAYIEKNPDVVSVDSVTLTQFVLAKTKTVSDVQNDILDVNLDGVLDVNDTTFLQLALAA